MVGDEFIHVPDAVISVAIKPKEQISKQHVQGSQRFKKRSTFRVSMDPETNETIVSGMGELHLEVYIERMRREYKAEVGHHHPVFLIVRQSLNAPELTTHKKQTGGSGQYGRVAGMMEPIVDSDENFGLSMRLKVAQFTRIHPFMSWVSLTRW